MINDTNQESSLSARVGGQAQEQGLSTKAGENASNSGISRTQVVDSIGLTKPGKGVDEKAQPPLVVAKERVREQENDHARSDQPQLRASEPDLRGDDRNRSRLK